MQQDRHSAKIAAFFVGSALAFSALPSLGDATAKTAGPFIGTVVDTAGKPVAGATVWLLGSPKSEYEVLAVVAKTTSDEKGHFQIAGAKAEDPPGVPWGFLLTARDSHGRIGGQAHSFGPAANASSKPREGREITLQEAKDFHGRLVDTSGKPIAKARIRFESAWLQQPTTMTYALISLPPAVRDELAVESGVDGAFVVRDLPSVGHGAFSIRAAGYGKLRAAVNLEKPATLQIGKPGTIRGTLTCPANPQAITKGIALHVSAIENTWANRRQQPSDCEVSFSEDVVTRPDGTFQIEGVPAGTYSLGPQNPSLQMLTTPPFYVEDAPPVEVKPGETATATVVIRQAARLRGSVVDRQTGKGVSDAYVHLSQENGNNSGSFPSAPPTRTEDGMLMYQTPKSGEDGVFVMYARLGKATVVYQFGVVAADYRGSGPPQLMKQIEIKGDMTLDPVRLQRSSPLEGIVVDKAGKPVTDAAIFHCRTDMPFFMGREPNLRSDRNGKFTIRGVSQKSTLSVRARTNNAASEAVTVAVAEQKGPIRLVLDEKASFTVRGTVVDSAGKPIPHATIAPIATLCFESVDSHMSELGGRVTSSFSTNLPLDVCTADADGKFQVAGLWAGEKYDIKISADGFVAYGSGTIEGSAGAVHDFGKITLVASNGAVEGKVVDSAGKPLADVRVFNSGDAPEPIETNSDAAGKFRLQGFRVGPVYVFGEKEGYRFACVHTKTGATDVTITMRRNDETPPPRTLQTPPALYRQQSEVAQSLREKLPAPAANSLEFSGGLLHSHVAAIHRSLLKRADANLDETLADAEEMGPQSCCSSCQELVEHFAASDRKRADRCLEKGIEQARKLDGSNEAVALAGLGTAAIRMGDKEQGRKLIDEAMEIAAKWDPWDVNNEAFGKVAVAVSSVDLPKALGLLKKITQESRRTHYRAKVAVSLDDLPMAELLLKKVDDWTAERAYVILACRIAAKRPAEAIRLIENMKVRQYEDKELIRAASFGWMAVAVAPSHRTLACSLIDRGLAMCLHPPMARPTTWGVAPLGPRCWPSMRKRSAIPTWTV